MLKLLIGLFFSLFVINAMAEYEVNVYDSPSYKDKAVIEIVDNCQKSFRLLLDKKELGTDKSLKWLQKLHNDGLLDQCVKTIDN